MSVMPACANCGTALNGPYCAHCGQKASDLHRPIWWILGEFMDAVFGYDSRTFRTVWLLFAEPGEFTRRYNSGQRASLLPPFRLFIIATVLFFITLQVTGLAMVAFKMRTIDIDKLPPEAIEAIKKDSNAELVYNDDKTVNVVTMELFVPAESVEHVKLTDKQKASFAKASQDFKNEANKADADEAGWLRWMEVKGSRIGEGYQRALDDPLKLNGPLNVWLPRLMLVLVPIFALLLAVMHWWPKVFLFEHLVFSIHIHTVAFVALALAAAAAAILGDSGFLWAVWLILGVYLWMAMKRVYGRNWWLTTVKFLALISIYSIVLTAGVGIVFLIALSEI